MKVRWTAINSHQDKDRKLLISIRPETAHQAQKIPEEPDNLGHKRNHDVTSAAQINPVTCYQKLWNHKGPVPETTERPLFRFQY